MESRPVSFLRPTPEARGDRFANFDALGRVASLDHGVVSAGGDPPRGQAQRSQSVLGTAR